MIAVSYRSDSTGLVCGYAFGPDGTPRPIEAPGVEGEAGSFTWLHFDLSHRAAEQWMRRHLALPEAFFAAIADGSRSTRIEEAGEALVAVVNDVLYDFAFERSDFATLWVCVTPMQVVTARLRPLRTVDRLRDAVRAGERFGSTIELLVHLLRDQADVLVQIVRGATLRVDRIEDDIVAVRLDDQREALGALRRVLVRLQRLLAPEPAALFRLLNRSPPWIAPDDLRDLRQSTEEFSAGLSDAGALLERIKLLQEELAARINEQNNRSLFLLTVFTVLALPINIMAGLFGMNVGGVPFAADPHGFWTLLGLVAAFTGVALWTVLRRRR